MHRAPFSKRRSNSSSNYKKDEPQQNMTMQYNSCRNINS